MPASRSIFACALVAVSALLLPGAAHHAQALLPQLSADPYVGHALRGATPVKLAQTLIQGPDAVGSTYAELDDATARKLVRGCSLPHEVSGPGAAGSQIVLQLTVSEKGKLLTAHRVQGALTHQLGETLSSCRFAVYKVNGTPTAFHANITINVK